MNRLTRLVLKRPVTTLLAVLALVVFGFSSLTTLRLELIHSFYDRTNRTTSHQFHNLSQISLV